MKILIAVPCLEMVYSDFMRSLIDLEKPEGTVYTVIKNSLIYNARNLIAKNAIKYGFDRVLWLDSDILVQPDTLIRLSEDMDMGLDYVSGMYFMRTMPTKPVVYKDLWWSVKDNWVNVGSINYLDYPDRLFECAGTGFGCVMTSVSLLQKIQSKYGAPFTPMMGFGEDLAFCWRVSQEGVKMYCDPEVQCGHIGTVVIDENNYLRSKTEYNP